MPKWDRYEEIEEDEFFTVFRSAILDLPNTSGQPPIFEDESAFDMVNGERIFSAKFYINTSPVMIKAYSGYDRVEGSRYGDALRLIGFVKTLDGEYRPIGSARKLKLRTYHTQGWKKNFSRRVDEVYQLLWERTRHGAFIPTTREYVMSELSDIKDKIRIVKDIQYRIDVKVGNGKWLEEREFKQVIKTLKRLGFRFDAQLKVWFIVWE